MSFARIVRSIALATGTGLFLGIAGGLGPTLDERSSGQAKSAVRPEGVNLATAHFAAAVADPFLVRNYGAVGDGVTDDTRSIQAAILAAESHGGGLVQLDPLTYSISSLVVSGSDVTVSGPATLVSHTAPYVTTTGARTHLSQLTLRHAGDRTGNPLVSLVGSQDSIVDRITVDASTATTNYGPGIGVSQGSDRAVVQDSNLINRNQRTLINHGWDSIYVSDSAQVAILRNTIMGGVQYGINVLSQTGASTGAQIAGNVVESTAAEGIVVWNGGAHISGNTVRHPGIAGIFVTGDPMNGITNAGTVVENNLVETVSSIGITLENDVVDATLVGNRVTADGSEAISMVRSIVRVSVLDNIVTGSGGVYGAIAVPAFGGTSTSHGLVIRGNHVSGCTNSAIYLEDGAGSLVTANIVTGCGREISVGPLAAGVSFA